MRRVSLKRARLLVKRRAVIAALAATDGGQVCRLCHRERAVDAHELLMRSQGGSITDAANIVPLCRACHDWIHAHPRLAYMQGWLIRGNHVIRKEPA